MKCPKCGSTDVYEVKGTTATTQTGWIKCYVCCYVFRIYYAPYKEG